MDKENIGLTMILEITQRQLIGDLRSALPELSELEATQLVDQFGDYIDARIALALAHHNRSDTTA